MLLDNGNKEAVFDVSKLTAFEVIVPSTVDVPQDVPQDVTQDVTQGGTQDDTQGVTQNVTQGVTQDVTQGVTQGKKLDMWIEEQIRNNPQITTEELAKSSGFTSRTIKRHIIKLSHIRYVGSGYSGHWEIVENDAEA